MRLIDADAMRQDWLENGQNEYVYDTNAVLDSIDAQSTIDAVPVVRCKDCVKRGGSECPMLFPLAYGYADFTSHNGYCDRGERRSDP